MGPVGSGPGLPARSQGKREGCPGLPTGPSPGRSSDLRSGASAPAPRSHSSPRNESRDERGSFSPRVCSRRRASPAPTRPAPTRLFPLLEKLPLIPFQNVFNSPPVYRTETALSGRGESGRSALAWPRHRGSHRGWQSRVRGTGSGPGVGWSRFSPASTAADGGLKTKTTRSRVGGPAGVREPRCHRERVQPRGPGSPVAPAKGLVPPLLPLAWRPVCLSVALPCCSPRCRHRSRGSCMFDPATGRCFCYGEEEGKPPKANPR